MLHPDFLLDMSDALDQAETLSTGMNFQSLLRCLSDQRIALADAIVATSLDSSYAPKARGECAKVAAWATVIWNRLADAPKV